MRLYLYPPPVPEHYYYNTDIAKSEKTLSSNNRNRKVWQYTMTCTRCAIDMGGGVTGIGEDGSAGGIHAINPLTQSL